MKKEDKTRCGDPVHVLMRVLGKERLGTTVQIPAVCQAWGDTGMSGNQSPTLGFTSPRGCKSDLVTLDVGAQAAKNSPSGKQHPIRG